MKSHTTERFRKSLAMLPERIRGEEREACRLFRGNPRHPSLHFKPIHPTKSIYSVRAGIDYRAVGTRDGEDIVWFWIGSHEEYDKLVARLRSM